MFSGLGSLFLYYNVDYINVGAAGLDFVLHMLHVGNAILMSAEF